MTVLNGVISYPIPLYSNVPIEPQFYQPRRFVISAITLGQTTTITTTEDHDYVVGQQVRLLIPPSFGSYQLNQQAGYVMSIPSSTQFVLNLYSIGIDAFISSSATTKAQTLAIGDVNTGPINTSGRTNNITFIPGSFINISPN